MRTTAASSRMRILRVGNCLPATRRHFVGVLFYMAPNSTSFGMLFLLYVWLKCLRVTRAAIISLQADEIHDVICGGKYRRRLQVKLTKLAVKHGGRLAILHTILLHESGSNYPLGIRSNSDLIPFHIYFSTNDIIGLTMITILLLMSIIFLPNYST